MSIDTFLTEWLGGNLGTSDDIVAVMMERFRNSQDSNVGMTLSQADEVLTAMGYSSAAKQGVLDIYDLLVAGTIHPDDVVSALKLAEGAWPHHTTVTEIKERVGG